MSKSSAGPGLAAAVSIEAATGVTTGISAAVLHLFNHALIKGALFLALGAVVYRLGSVTVHDLAGLGIELPAEGDYGVGVVFLPRDAKLRADCEAVLEKYVTAEGQTVLGWRDVPTDNSGLGESVKAVEPVIRQVFISPALVAFHHCDSPWMVHRALTEADLAALRQVYAFERIRGQSRGHRNCHRRHQQRKALARFQH